MRSTAVSIPKGPSHGPRAHRLRFNVQSGSTCRCLFSRKLFEVITVKKNNYVNHQQGSVGSSQRDGSSAGLMRARKPHKLRRRTTQYENVKFILVSLCLQYLSYKISRGYYAEAKQKTSKGAVRLMVMQWPPSRASE